MKKILVIGLVGLILGAVLGAMLQQRAIRQRQHALAVMWLAQFHLKGLQTAVEGGDCAAAGVSASRIQGLADELALALPLAVEQEATFRGYVEQLRTAAAPVAQVTGACAYDAAMLKRVRDTCADCHLDYR